MGRNLFLSVFCNSDEPKSGLARDLGDRLQSRNVPFGTSGDCGRKKAEYVRKSTEDSIRFREKESIIKEEKM